MESRNDLVDGKVRASVDGSRHADARSTPPAICDRANRTLGGLFMKVFAQIILALGIAAAPVAMAQNSPPNGGLLITQVGSQWQVRLLSGTTQQQFSGTMQSNLPITGVQPVQLESHDSATLTTPNSLAATFATWPGGMDGVNFTLSAGATLCLRNSGSASVNIYVGASLADAVPVTAPVALAGTNACGSSGGTGNRKFHAGQWIVMGENASSQELMSQSIEPGVTGLVKRYTWRSMETSQGVYDFSALQSDLAWAAANGMRLIAMIDDKSFDGTKSGPAYLDNYEAVNNMGGYTMVRWAPTVVTRFNALVKALGAQVDSNKNFEGIATQETALSLDPSVAKAFNYSAAQYRDAYISMLTAAAASLPTSRVFWFMNFLVGGQDYIADIASAVAPLGVLMGGPDVWPDNQSLEKAVYPYYAQFAGKMPLFAQVENVCYSEPHMTSGFTTKYWTMPQLFAFATTKLHVNYMFWVRVTKPSPADAYDWMNALPVIAANPTFTPAP
jgi:hypothetical protein